MSARPVIGFIGLGSQGGPMAERILDADFNLMVWARRPEALEPFVAKGARTSPSVEELGAGCDQVCVCVVDDAGVAQICDQLIPAMQPGSCLVIHSTILPESCVALAKDCAAKGIGFLDAPVSGGGPAAAAGKLTVMCGGDADSFARCEPVFASFAGLTVHLGEAGSGQRAKIVNNSLMAASMGLAHAAMQAAGGLDIDRAAFAELVKGSSGRSFGFETYARLPEPSVFAHGAALLAKDVDLLKSTLPGDDGAELLRTTAMTFLDAARGE
ncbi:NAD(P)-dependent oxidoreductase [Novosphingobium sp. YJ-S2-02]|uniref:NAD(P)-dependent oxidoreductase n=1 Tax=Novosphingobium aureum TaxID=2792964 RepID=A0A931MKL5_9SPHN|nr:NAD(P)-dependent oxidoreductase [Novosphingobium aureum]MBH0112106.1 NAD(P)-dependent oxidoreductase [Novosphingobium aureum]